MKRKRTEPQESRSRPPPHTQVAIRIRRSFAEIGEPGQVAVDEAISDLTNEILALVPEMWSSVLDMAKAIAFEQPHKVPFLAIVFEQVNKQRTPFAEAAVDMIREQIVEALEAKDAARLKSFLRFACTLTIVEPSSLLSLLEELAQDTSEEMFVALFMARVYLELSHPDADTKKLDELLSKFVEEYKEREFVPPFKSDSSSNLVITHLVAAAKSALNDKWDVSFLPRFDDLAAREPVETLHRLRAIQVPEESKFGALDQQRIQLYKPQNGVHSVPSPDSLFGCVSRDLASDIILNMDFNRKEVTRQLITLDLFLNKDKFCAPATPFDALQSIHDDGAPTIKVEDIAVEAVLEQLLQLPQPHFPYVYYSSILVEACIMAPMAIAPVLGRAVRYLFSQAEALDTRLFWRVVSWFAHHMSNFSFTWKWPEWSQYLNLPRAHPKYVFMEQLIVKQVQLSYPQRVRDVLPDEFLDLVPDVPEQPDFEFKDDKYALDLVDNFENKPREALDEARAAVQEQFLGRDAASATEHFERLLVAAVCEIGNRSLTHASRTISRVGETLKGEVSGPKVVSSVLKYWNKTPWVGLLVLQKFVDAELASVEDVAKAIVADEALLLSSAGYDFLYANEDVTKECLNLLPSGDEWTDWWADRYRGVFL